MVPMPLFLLEEPVLKKQKLNCDSASREGGFEEADPSHKAKGLFG